MKTSYHLSPDGQAIICDRCGKTSHNMRDVALRFCGACGIFHEIEECDRQLLLLGLALMAIQRPGFKYAAQEAAKKLLGEQMFLDFIKYNTMPDGSPLPPRPAPEPGR